MITIVKCQECDWQGPDNELKEAWVYVAIPIPEIALEPHCPKCDGFDLSWEDK